MRTFWNKKTVITLLSGMMFLCGGVFTAKAQSTIPVVSAQQSTTQSAQQPVANTTQTVYRFQMADGSISQDYQTRNDCTSARDMVANAITDPTQRLRVSSCFTYNSQLGQGGVFDPNSESSPLKFLSQMLSCKGFSSCAINWLLGGPAIVSYLIYQVSGLFLSGTAHFFDSVLALSIDKNFIAQPFINDVWTILRDFANMAFIFILLYTGIMTMISGADWKRPVLNVVIIAIFLNFSLFFTKVIIDSGNILAVGIFSAIGEPSATPSVTGSVGEREISSSISSSIEIQKIVKSSEKISEATHIIILFLIGTIINVLVAWALIRASLIFIGRVIGLWFLMVVSPIAFVSFAVPKLNKLNEWISTLLNLTFVAPVFLFFLYIILKIIAEGGLFQSVLLSATTSSNPLFDALFVPVVMTLFIYKALDLAVKYAKDTSGAFGDMGATLIGGALGVASVAGTTGVRALGAVGGTLANKGGVLGKVGEAAAKTAHAGRNLTFDARNISVPGVAGGGTVGSRLGLGEGSKQTYTSTRDAAVKKQQEETKRAKEKPMSIAQALEKDREKERKAEAKKEGNKAKVPDLQNKLRDMENDYAQLSRDNGDVVDPQTGKITNRGTVLKQNLTSEESRLKVADAQVTANPNDPLAAANHLRALHQRNNAAEKLKKYDDAEDKIEKLKNQIEEYENL